MKGAVRRAAALAAGLLWLGGCQWIWPERYMLRDAQQLEAQAKYQEAAAKYEELYQKYSAKPEALTALSRAAALYEERLGNWQKAASFLQELRSRTENKPEYPSVLLRLARVLENGGSPYKDSLETYGIICKNCASAPESAEAMMAQGRIHESLQNWVAAKSDYENAIAKLGTSPKAAAVRTRLQSVWLLEALDAYYAGKVEDGVTLAGEALKKELTVPEVKRGLEDLVRRYRNAQRLWDGNAGLVILDDQSFVGAVDASRFIVRAERTPSPVTPEGWSFTVDAKRGTFTVAQALPPVAADPAAKGKARKTEAKKAWSFKSSSENQALGWWWSADGSLLAWIDKARGGHKRTLRILEPATRKTWSVFTDPAGEVLGESVLILPHARKLIFPYKDFLAVSDLRGGNMVNFLLHGDKDHKVKFRGRNVEYFASSADGLEVAVAVRQGTAAKAPAKGKGDAEPAPADLAIWKLGLAVAEP